MTSPASMPPPLPHIRGPDEFADCFEVSGETLDRLIAYADTLQLWQARINLVSPATLPDLWHRHMADSAQLLALAPPAPSTWVDLGSGAGFPGLVIAILLAGRPEPRPHITLVDSDQRKCAFLAEVLRRTGIAPLIPVDILCARIEAATTRARLATVDVVSARALAPLGALLELAAPLLGPSSTGLLLKGRGAEVEVDEARRSWQFSFDVVPSRTDKAARIVRVRGPVARSEGGDL
jgi:16S rRNA (guanine527-N7)-methyltransferase